MSLIDRMKHLDLAYRSYGIVFLEVEIAGSNGWPRRMSKSEEDLQSRNNNTST